MRLSLGHLTGDPLSREGRAGMGAHQRPVQLTVEGSSVFGLNVSIHDAAAPSVDVTITGGLAHNTDVVRNQR